MPIKTILTLTAIAFLTGCDQPKDQTPRPIILASPTNGITGPSPITALTRAAIQYGYRSAESGRSLEETLERFDREENR